MLAFFPSQNKPTYKRPITSPGTSYNKYSHIHLRNLRLHCVILYNQSPFPIFYYTLIWKILQFRSLFSSAAEGVKYFLFFRFVFRSMLKWSVFSPLLSDCDIIIHHLWRLNVFIAFGSFIANWQQSASALCSWVSTKQITLPGVTCSSPHDVM